MFDATIAFDLDHDQGYSETYDAFVNGSSLAELEARLASLHGICSPGWIEGAECAIHSARDYIYDA